MGDESGPTLTELTDNPPHMDAPTSDSAGCEITDQTVHMTQLAGPNSDKHPVTAEQYTPASTPPSVLGGTRESLSQNAQQLIDDINAKRKQDTQLVADFKKELDMQAMKACSMVEQNMFDLYETQGKVIQTKLQQLFSTLERIDKLKSELQQVRKALGLIYQDVSH